MARVFTDNGGQALASANQTRAVLDTFSVAFWMFRTATPAVLADLIASAGAQDGWHLTLTTGNLVQASISNATVDKVRVSTTAPALNAWVHAVVTHLNTGIASTDFTFYFNGKSEAGTNVSSSSGAHTATAQALTVGANAVVANRAPPVTFGLVAIWDRVISPAEALALATGMHPTRFPEGLVEYFTMESAQHEKGALVKLFLVAGATIPTNAAVNPPIEALPSPRANTRIGRHFVPATAGRTLFVQGALDGIGGAGKTRFYPGQAA
jgi:hypothetical protein